MDTQKEFFGIPGNRLPGTTDNFQSQSDTGNPAGLFMNYEDARKLVSGSEDHCIVYGYNCSRKSERIALPLERDMLEKGESIIVVTQRKKDLTKIAGSIPDFYQRYYIDFQDPFTSPDTWNPLSLICSLLKSHHPKDNHNGNIMLNDLITNLFALSEPDDWHKYSKLLVEALIHILAEKGTNEQQHFASITDMLVKTEYEDEIFSGIEKLCKRLAEESPARKKLGGYLNSTNSNRQTVNFVTDPVVSVLDFSEVIKKMLSADTVKIREIDIERPFFLSIIFPECNTKLRILTSLMLTQIMTWLGLIADGMNDQQLPVRCNLVLDQSMYIKETFPTLPEWFSTKQDQNIRIFLLIQNEAQLNAYGEDNANNIKGNTGVTIDFPAYQTDSHQNRANCTDTDNSGGKFTTMMEHEKMTDGTAVVDIRERNKFAVKFPLYSEIFEIADWIIPQPALNTDPEVAIFDIEKYIKQDNINIFRKHIIDEDSVNKSELQTEPYSR